MQISGHSKSCHNTTFGSVIPIKVFIDGQQTADRKLIEKSCRLLEKELTTRPQSQDAHYNNIIHYMSKDMDYMPKEIFDLRRQNPEMTPSTFLRVIHNYARDCSFLITGHDANILASVGKSIGIAHKQSRFAVEQAKKIYGEVVEKILQNKQARVLEHCNRRTHQKDGVPIQLQLNMKSNGKYGLSTFKLQMDEITFTK